MSDFFDDQEVDDIAQSHIEQVSSLEEKQTKKILSSYKRVRQELRDRLDMIPPGTFTAQKMSGTLYQVQAAIDALTRNLQSDMLDSAQVMGEKGIENLITELNKLSKKFTGAVVPINIDAAVIATETKNLLLSRYESSLQSYNGLLRARIAQGLTDAVIAQDDLPGVVSRVGKTFMAEEWKLQQIARTELMNIYSQGKLSGMSELWNDGKGDIPDLKKTCFAPMDSRTGKDSKYADKLKLIVAIDEPFIYYWDGKRREFMAPPDRPNDRQILIPYRESWKSR